MVKALSDGTYTSLDWDARKLHDDMGMEVVSWGASVSKTALHVNAGGGNDYAVVMNVDDAQGTDTTWVEWAILGMRNADNNWRMGIVDSNLVVQVRVCGNWTNATEFARP